VKHSFVVGLAVVSAVASGCCLLVVGWRTEVSALCVNRSEHGNFYLCVYIGVYIEVIYWKW